MATGPPPDPDDQGLTRSARPEDGGAPEVSLVVPFYNPGPAVRTTIERAAAALSGTGVSFEIIAVNDGATDDSPASIEDLLPGVLTTIVLPFNRGKGHAVRTGMARARGRLVGFIDADGDIPPEILPEFVRRAEETGADILFGSKRHRDSAVEVPWVRRLSSSGYRLLARALFRLSVPDTQTGVKLLRSEVTAAILPKMREERFAFDLELFVLAQRCGYRSFVEVPVRVDKQYTSTVSAKAVRTIVWDTLKLFLRFRVFGRGLRASQSGERNPVHAGRGVPDKN